MVREQNGEYTPMIRDMPADERPRGGCETAGRRRSTTPNSWRYSYARVATRRTCLRWRNG
jgi:hypothetical protein